MTSSDVLMGLGSYRFSISTAAYDSFERSSSWKWSAQRRVGRRPALQYLGPGRDDITLAGTIYPHYAGGLGQMDKMRSMADTGNPLTLVDGLGKVWGKWCIKSISESQSSFLQGGVPRKIVFRVRLVRYGEDT